MRERFYLMLLAIPLFAATPAQSKVYFPCGESSVVGKISIQEVEVEGKKWPTFNLILKQGSLSESNIPLAPIPEIKDRLLAMGVREGRAIMAVRAPSEGTHPAYLTLLDIKNLDNLAQTDGIQSTKAGPCEK